MTAKLNIQMQNDRRSGHLLQGFVKWLVGQRPSFSSACRPSCHSLLRLQLLRRTWPTHRVGQVIERRDSCYLRIVEVGQRLIAGQVALGGVIFFENFNDLANLADVLGIFCQRHEAATDLLELGDVVGDSDDFECSAVFHIFSFLLAGLIALRWSKYIPTAWVMQYKSSTIIWREIANGIKPLNH